MSLAALPLVAAAQPVTGVYVGAGAGANLKPDLQGSGITIASQQPGFVGLGALGYGFGNGARLEVEGNYRNNDIDTVTLNGARIGTSGHVQQYGVMANLLFDFDLSSFGITPNVYQPYFGAGIGYAWTGIRNASLAPGGSLYRIGETDGRFAWQAIAGAAFGLGGLVPGLAVTAEYRFFSTSDPRFALDQVSGPAVAGVPGRFDTTNNNHAVLLGLRYAFNATPAPAEAAPVPAPAPAPARTFLVFFDWNRADLTDRAKQIIAEAAQAARRSQTTRVEVAGHADRSGTPQYNQALSQRRAEVVANELVRQGVGRDEISITAYGESRPLVPTADGVREPQNRRVEIVLR